MKNILIVGAGACGLAISKILSAQGLSSDEVIIVTSENIHKHEEEIKKQNPLSQESILIHAQPRFDEYIPTRQEIESHPFSKFIGKPKGKKGRW
jgi:malic enzyme